jgi:hypothetical protein
MEYAFFTFVWLVVVVLAIVGARVALGIVLDLRDRLGFRLIPELLRRRP